MIRNGGSQITQYYVWINNIFENILSIRVLERVVILTGCKMSWRQENLKINLPDYAY